MVPAVRCESGGAAVTAGTRPTAPTRYISSGDARERRGGRDTQNPNLQRRGERGGDVMVECALAGVARRAVARAGLFSAVRGAHEVQEDDAGRAETKRWSSVRGEVEEWCAR